MARPGIRAMRKRLDAGTRFGREQRSRDYFRFARTPMRSSRGSTSSQKYGSSLR